MKDKLRGIFAPISTPFSPNGDVDYIGLKHNMGKYAASGVKGYLALGSNGENKSLTNDEKLAVLETIIRHKGADQVVMAGCIFESTRETIAMAREMAARGADFLTLLPPCYFKRQMTDDVLLRYFSDVADQAAVPCLVYNAPQYAGGVGLSASLVKRCCEHPNIVGLKDSGSGSIEGYLFAVRNQMDVLAGSANNFLMGMLLGASGGVLSLSNSFPELAVRLYDALMAQDYALAVALNEQLLRVNRAVSGKGGVAAVKYAMELNGYVGGEPRLPLLPLSDDEKWGILAALRKEQMIP